LTRVVVPATEQAWLEAARGKTLRELEALVSDKSAGDAPDAPPSGAPRRHILRFEVDADTFATFREALQSLQRAGGGRLDHDALLLAMARQILGGPTDAGRGSYQISLHVCAACGRGQQVAGGEGVAVDPAVVEMAECDAQQLGSLLTSTATEQGANENGAPSSSSASPPAEAANVVDPGTAGRCSNHAHVDVDAHESSGGASALPRARQSIPPAVRRAVLERDRGRCQVPGCTHATFVDVHHVHARADGGASTPNNLLTLCSAHHRATHRGQLHIERGLQGALIYRHADGSAYGHSLSPERIDAQTKVFSALRHLGFRELEVKSVLAELRGDAALAQATVNELLREALCRIERAT